MHYISLDLEWNCTKIGKNKFLNEIIEIGAVKLNKKLKEISRFSIVIKPQYTKKLNKYVKKLTHISEDELKNGVPFEQAVKLLKKWAGKNAVILTWSNTDLYVLLENYNHFLNKQALDFMSGYVDLQKYVEKFIPTTKGFQVSLSNAAQMLGLETEGYHLHRALDDSLVGAQLLSLTYNKKALETMIQPTKDERFFKRYTFKAFYIQDINDPDIDHSIFDYKCDSCKVLTKIQTKPKLENNAFFVITNCPCCKQNFKVKARFKKTFDSVLTSRTVQKLTIKKVRKKGNKPPNNNKEKSVDQMHKKG